MAKIQSWSPEEAQQELRKRLGFAQQARRNPERYWRDAEQTVFGTGYNTVQRTNFYSNIDHSLESVDNSDADVNVSYAFKNIRFLHAQMSANPPSAIARPASNDPEDRQKADAADRLIRHAIRTYKMQEYSDQACLNTLVYGTGVLKVIWDSNLGAILDVDEDGNILTEGDIEISVPNMWDMFIDPDASTWDKVRYVFERKIMPYEQAVYLWPEKQELLKQIRQKYTSGANQYLQSGGTNPHIRKEQYDVVEIYEYWERGLPTNAYLGRYGVCLKDGEIIEPLRPNPHRFKPADDQKARYEVADLPFHLLTDIDVPNLVYGKSVLDYIAPIQQTMNRLDSLNLDNIQAHGATKMVLPESAEIAEQITTSPWDVVRITGNQPPFMMSPPNTMPTIDKLREQVRMGIDDMAGVNESMFGQQSRETAGFAMQYATNQGNMIRRRLFNKYAMFVESIYKGYLNLIRKHWDTKRTIYVLGKEKALEAVEIQGADISGGYDLIVEYGASLSLDPMTRREEILSLQPIFEKAGVPVRVSLKMMKLNELEGLYDMMQLAEDRQREIFEEMIANNTYIPPEEFQDHVNMLAYAMQYVMTTEYKYLEEDKKALVKQHIRDRGALSAQEAAGQMPNPGGPLQPGPGAGMPGESPLAGASPLAPEAPAEAAPAQLPPGGPVTE